MRRHAGFALILVIWSLVLMSSLATGFAFAVRHETRVAGDLASIAQAEAASAAALGHAVLALSDDDEEARWQADGQPHELEWPDAKISVRVRAESSRIDLNRASPEILRGLLLQLVHDVDHYALVDAIVDWRDADDRPEPSGAEDVDYERAGYDYVPPNRPFSSVNELSQVMGFDNRMVETLIPHLTIHSQRDRIHATSAGRVVLAAIPGIEPADLDEFLARREIALAEREPLDMQPLRQGTRYLDSRPGDHAYSLLIDVQLPDGMQRKERIAFRLQAGREYTILAREAVPAPYAGDGAEP